MSDPFSRPKVAKVTTEIETVDGNRVRFTYRADYPDREPDSGAGMELDLAQTADREEDRLDPTRIAALSYGLTLTLRHARHFAIDLLPAHAPDPAEAGPTELSAGQLALEVVGE